MDKGWIKLHRRIAENHFLMNDETAFVLFMKLLLTVGKEKGQIAGGKYDLAKRFGMNSSRFYRAMLRLEKEGIVNREVNHKYSIYTICNWHRYQSYNEPQSDPGANHERTTSEHYNKKKKKKNIYSDFEFLEPALSEFVKMRRLIKKPMTDLAINRLVDKLAKMFPNNPENQQASLLQSVDHNWQTVYELKHEVATTSRKETDAWL